MGTLSKTPKPVTETASNANIVTPPKISENRIYELHEYDPDKIVTGQINPDRIDPLLFPEYKKNTNGIVIFDKNSTELSTQRTLINLTSTKTSVKKFNEIVDTEIQEFTETLNLDTTFLSNKIAALESALERARAASTTLNNQVTNLSNENEALKTLTGSESPEVARLKREIDNLKRELDTVKNAGRDNEVSDTLVTGVILYSDRTGAPGTPGAPKIQNLLLSKNRTARAIIQPNGNFDVFTGQYSTRGVPLVPETQVFFNSGYDNSGAYRGETVNGIYRPDSPANSVAFTTIAVNPEVGGLQVGRIVRRQRQWVGSNNITSTLVNGQHIGTIINWNTPPQRTTRAARLQLTDTGILNLFDGGGAILWTSYGL